MAEPQIDTSDFEVDSTEATAEQVREELDAAQTVEVTDLETESTHEDEPEPAQQSAKVDRRTRAGRAASIQAEIDKDTARATAAKQQADAEEARLTALRTDRTTSKPALERTETAQGSTIAEPDDPEPTIEQFAASDDPYTSWARALSRWEARQEYRTQDAKRQQADAQRRQVESFQQATDTAAAAFVERVKADVGDVAKFHGTVAPEVLAIRPFHPSERPTGFTAIADSILSSLHPAKLQVYFTAHLDEFKRIGGLPPHVALHEVGILEGTLRAQAASRGPATRSGVSTAPPPIKPLGGSPSVSDRDDSDIDDESPEAFDRYNRRMNAKNGRPKR